MSAFAHLVSNVVWSHLLFLLSFLGLGFVLWHSVRLQRLQGTGVFRLLETCTRTSTCFKEKKLTCAHPLTDCRTDFLTRHDAVFKLPIVPDEVANLFPLLITTPPPY